MSVTTTGLFFCFLVAFTPSCPFWFPDEHYNDDICYYCAFAVYDFCREFDYDLRRWCYCDRLCPYYEDCCLNTTLLPAPALFPDEDIVWFDKLVCEVANNYLVPNISLQMIVSCDDNWTDDDVRRRCEVTDKATLSEEIQVLFTTSSGVTFMFKNVYCALCNNIKDTTPLRIEVSDLESCDVLGLRENLKIMSYTEAFEKFFSNNCTYYLSTFGMKKQTEIKRYCGWNNDQKFFFTDGLGSLFDFLPDTKNTSYKDNSDNGEFPEICPKYAYLVENKCINFSFSLTEKFVSYLFEIEGHMDFSEIEIYARAFLEFLEWSYRMETHIPSEYKSLILNWALNVDYGYKSSNSCTIVELDALLFDSIINTINLDNVLKYPCFTKRCYYKNIPMARPVQKMQCRKSKDPTHFNQSWSESPLSAISLENRLSVASSSVSVVALAGSIIFCIKCPLYHNLPGRNSLSLMVTLFVAHVLFLSGILLKSESMECTVVGILIHWSWLTVFVLMSVCSFHTWFAFSTYGFVKLKYAKDKRRMFFVYNFVGYGVPTVVTGVCVILYVVCPSCNFNYGTTSCFISNPTMLGATFAAPTGFLWLMNMIFFAVMIRSVRNLPILNTNEHYLNRNNLMIYLKLSLMIGFTWILRYVAEFVQLKWVLYISILMNGSQGLHVFLSHVCNQRALNFIRTRRDNKGRNTETDTITKDKITRF